MVEGGHGHDPCQLRVKLTGTIEASREQVYHHARGSEILSHPFREAISVTQEGVQVRMVEVKGDIHDSIGDIVLTWSDLLTDRKVVEQRGNIGPVLRRHSPI
jgi:hypothetical protein